MYTRQLTNAHMNIHKSWLNPSLRCRRNLWLCLWQECISTKKKQEICSSTAYVLNAAQEVKLLQILFTLK